ncbi:hypothetical protein LGD11_005200, partial [Escherichia coli]|nr:hypothetical protein [Escherichia coli]
DFYHCMDCFNGIPDVGKPVSTLHTGLYRQNLRGNRCGYLDGMLKEKTNDMKNHWSW